MAIYAVPHEDKWIGKERRLTAGVHYLVDENRPGRSFTYTDDLGVERWAFWSGGFRRVEGFGPGDKVQTRHGLPARILAVVRSKEYQLAVAVGAIGKEDDFLVRATVEGRAIALVSDYDLVPIPPSPRRHHVRLQFVRGPEIAPVIVTVIDTGQEPASGAFAVLEVDVEEGQGLS